MLQVPMEHLAGLQILLSLQPVHEAMLVWGSGISSVSGPKYI